MRREKKERLSKTAASGIVALIFLILGFQLAIFVLKVVERPPAAGDARPEPDMTQSTATGASEAKYQSSEASGTAKTRFGGYPRPGMTQRPAPRSYESFAFDPNTVSPEDLQRLGLSARQAETIGHYREKGGRFRSKEDFRKMYVVSDTLYARLEPYIEIPKLELNAADSAALVTLHGIGPYYARKILAYRERLGGFLDVAQLLEIEGIDEERLAGFADAVEADPARCRRLDLWQAPDSALARHPYLGPKGARSIARYKTLYDTARWTLADLEKERVLPPDDIEKLKKYIEIQ